MSTIKKNISDWAEHDVKNNAKTALRPKISTGEIIWVVCIEILWFLYLIFESKSSGLYWVLMCILDNMLMLKQQQLLK